MSVCVLGPTLPHQVEEESYHSARWTLGGPKPGEPRNHNQVGYNEGGHNQGDHKHGAITTGGTILTQQEAF